MVTCTTGRGSTTGAGFAASARAESGAAAVGDTVARAVDRIAGAMLNMGGDSIADAGSARAVDPIVRPLFVSTCDGVETVAPVSRD